MDSYQPLYQVYHLVNGELVKDFETFDKDKAIDRMNELRSMGLKQVHIQYAFKHGGIAKKYAKGGAVETMPVDPELSGMSGQLTLFAEVNEIPLTKENVAERLRVEREEEKEPQLTLLSFGGGQDSWAILYKIIHDPVFKKRYAPNDLMVVMSDTGNEHPYTYKAIKEARELCEKHGIFFHFITNDQGYHTPGWMTLKDNLIRNKTILSATMGVKACTGSLKINPLDKFMYEYMCKKYGFPELSNKGAWNLYQSKFRTKARVILGFAKDEERRVLNSKKATMSLPIWKQRHIQFVFPLIEEGWNRHDAQQIILQHHSYLVPPSNCMICFYQSDAELLWLWRNYPDEFKEWAEIEKAKLERTKDDPKNYGVYGKWNLWEKLEKAKLTKDESGKPYGEYTDAELWEYKLSHGHCVKSTF